MIEHLIGAPDHQGEEPRAQEIADEAAQGGGEAGIGGIAPHDFSVGVAKRLEGTDFRTLLFHHAGHGARANQRRHQEEEHREDGGKSLDDGGVVVKSGVAGVGGAPQGIGGEGGALKLCQVAFAVLELLKGVVQLLLGVAELLVGFQHAVFIFLKAIVVFLPAVVELLAGVAELLFALGQGVLVAALIFGFAVLELFEGVIQLHLGVGQLLLAVGQLLHAVIILRQAFFIFCPGVVQLLPGVYQGGVALTQRRLIALFKFRFAVLQLFPVFIQGGLPCGKPCFNLADALLKLRYSSLRRGNVCLACAGLLEIGEIRLCLFQLGLQGGKLGFGLGFLGFKLRLARLIGRPAVVELLARCRKLGVAGGILGQGLQRGLALVVFCLTLPNLL